MPTGCIYLDYFSTTPVDPRVLEYYCQILKQHYGNPSSVDHDIGSRAARLIKTKREIIADLLSCMPGEITFTSGATESISLFLQGYASLQVPRLGRPLEVITSPVEHPSVLENLRVLQQQGKVNFQMLTVDTSGRIDLTELRDLLKFGADLVCIMAVNNEIGNIYPCAQIASLASEYKALYFCDATQAIGKIPFSLANLPDTVVVFSGHKFYAPKGIAVLVADRAIPLKPLFYGGSQEHGLRPGTVNAPLIAALAYALEIACTEQISDAQRIAALRDNLEVKLRARFSDLIVNGDHIDRVPGALHIIMPGISNKELIARIRDRLAISTGAACSSGSERPSHVLTAMRMPSEFIEGALRISLGRFTTEDEISAAESILATALSG